MPDDQHDDLPVDNELEEEAADEREPHIGPEARFTIGGKPLPLDEFVASTMGELADREPAPPEPPPPGQPKEIVWASRRPL